MATYLRTLLSPSPIPQTGRGLLRHFQERLGYRLESFLWASPGSAKAMKRKRRIEVQIEHREFSVFSAYGEMTQAWPGCTTSGSGLREMRPEACPVCGATEMVPLAEGMASAGLAMSVLRDGLENCKFHVQHTGSGAWWVCRHSLQQS